MVYGTVIDGREEAPGEVLFECRLTVPLKGAYTAMKRPIVFSKFMFFS